MTAIFYWRRTDPALIGPDPLDLVPSWSDDAFDRERKAGILVAASDTGELITNLLRMADRPADLLPDDLETDSPSVLSPDQVTDIASALAGIDPEELVQEFRTELADAAEDLGYRRPFDDEWADSVATDLADLRTLFALAAEAGEAVIVTVDA